MLIPHKNFLEKCMDMKFNDLKEKHLKLKRAQWQLREKLQSKACDLFHEYSESLSLPSETWQDSQGNFHPYVKIGVWTNPRKFESTPFPGLQMDEEYRLNFVISTTLDDSPMTGGYQHGVSISLWYDHVVLYAAVGGGDDTIILQVSPLPGGFLEVCAAIKALIDTAIARATPSAIIV
ncbi:Uncharacterised protein [Yersinia enterocolitica]|nr:Uncharacterised protein [Yersinia enterocolitica]SUP65435.1 Uncharacterised protein [Yersinia enterocolitica]HDM8272751.1 hypothetical protein [Yersinia enterocolitica]HED5565357.1 hypothetical protein [Yersinia enterocolitica]